jgi:hypothetical protein
MLTTIAAAIFAALLGVRSWNAASRSAEKSEEFQRLVGGLGLGPALELSECDFGFDPRIGARCVQDLGPIPAGTCFCRQHAFSILSYRELTWASWSP